MDIKSGKRIKKIEPKVLIEVKRKGSKIRDYQSKTHYSRGIGSFSTPQNNLTNYESLNVKVRFKSPEKALMSNIIENERSSIQTDIPDFHIAPQVEIQSTKIYKNKNGTLRNNKFLIEESKGSDKHAENITIAYLSNTLGDESMSQKKRKFRK